MGRHGTIDVGTSLRVSAMKHARALAFSIALSALICSRSLLVTASLQQREGGYEYDPVAVVMCTELFKLFLASVLYLSESSSKRTTLFSDYDGKTALLYVVPAILYSIQNNIVFLVLTYVNPPTFELLSNLKIVTTAIVYRIVMKRRLTMLQYIAVAILTLAAVLGHLGNQNAKVEVKRSEQWSAHPLTSQLPEPGPLHDASMMDIMAPNQMNGLMLAIVYALLSAFAGVYSEKTLKGSSQSTHLQNMEIYFWSVLVSFIYAFFSGHNWTMGNFFDGFDSLTWVIIVNNAVMGQCVSFVMKYADNIVKVFAACVALFLSTFLSWMFFGMKLHLLLWIGFLLAICSMYLYFGPHNEIIKREDELQLRKTAADERDSLI